MHDTNKRAKMRQQHILVMVLPFVGQLLQPPPPLVSLFGLSLLFQSKGNACEAAAALQVWRRSKNNTKNSVACELSLTVAQNLVVAR